MARFTIKRQIVKEETIEIPDGVLWPDEYNVVDRVYLEILKSAQIDLDREKDTIYSHPDNSERALKYLVDDYELAQRIVGIVNDGVGAKQ